MFGDGSNHRNMLNFNQESAKKSITKWKELEFITSPTYTRKF